MARKRKGGRIFWRRWKPGAEPRAYADFRDFADVGGGREALIAPGGSTATTDEVIAEKLVADRLEELQERRRNKVLLGVEKQAGLKEFGSYHLVEKKRSGRFTDQWLASVELHLTAAVEFFGADRDLASIGVADIQRYAAHLSTVPNGRGKTLSGGSVRKYLNSLSNLYRRAIAEGFAQMNPVSAMMDKPTAMRKEARWLEVHEGALLLESARTFLAKRPAVALPFAHELVATFLLTGGRESEVLGLAVDDVSFDRKTVTFRPHPWRRLKTGTSHRTVPLWPQLEEILRPYVFGGDAPLGSLLFPSHRSNGESMLTDWRKPLDAIAERAGWKAGEIRSKVFRHTYCAARLQTLDRGAPVSDYTVAKELGHGGRALVDRVYGHLGEIRHRSDVVEYRVSQHLKVEGYADRVKVLREKGGLQLLA